MTISQCAVWVHPTNGSDVQNCGQYYSPCQTIQYACNQKYESCASTIILCPWKDRPLNIAVARVTSKSSCSLTKLMVYFLHYQFGFRIADCGDAEECNDIGGSFMSFTMRCPNCTEPSFNKYALFFFLPPLSLLFTADRPVISGTACPSLSLNFSVALQPQGSCTVAFKILYKSDRCFCYEKVCSSRQCSGICFDLTIACRCGVHRRSHRYSSGRKLHSLCATLQLQEAHHVRFGMRIFFPQRYVAFDCTRYPPEEALRIRVEQGVTTGGVNMSAVIEKCEFTDCLPRALLFANYIRCSQQCDPVKFYPRQIQNTV